MIENGTHVRFDEPRKHEQAVADALWSAVADGQSIEPPRFRMEAADLAAGYRIQMINVARAIGTGRRKVGYKIAMTSDAIQRQFGLEHPTSGTLFEEMVHENVATFDSSILKQGRLEGEIAFQMKSAVTDPDISIAALSHTIRHAFPSVEIINSRIKKWDVTPFDFVADNSAAESIVLGVTKLLFDEASLARIQMRMVVNGVEKSRGGGEACLGNPLNALHWLAVHLVKQGTPLQPDDIVMSGSLGPALPFQRGDNVEVKVSDAVPVRLNFI